MVLAYECQVAKVKPCPSFPANSAWVTTYGAIPRSLGRLSPAPTMISIRSAAAFGRKLPYQCSRKSFSTSGRRHAGEVRIVEVGPRDGLQNEASRIDLKTKLELLRRLAETGVRNIEAGSFVAPKWVPQV